MNIKRFVFNMFCVNTYVLWNNGKDAIIVDPGMMSESENLLITNFIEKNGLKPVRLINTHMHIDHIAGNSFIQEKYGLVAECNKSDDYLAERACEQAMMFGIPYNGKDLAIGKGLDDNEIIEFGDDKLKILHVPGHTRGHIAIYDANDKFVLSGDVLFQLGIGRTDLPGGDFSTLVNSIETKLFTLPDDTTVYPGHGGQTTIGYERKNNPYL